MPTLSVYRNGTLEWQGPVTDYTLRIGRSPDNDLVLEDPTKGVSRFHAELRWEHDGYVIADLGSQNGTWIAGERIGTASLTEGTEVALGPYRLVLEPEPAKEAEEVPTPPLPVVELDALPEEEAKPVEFADPNQAATMLPQEFAAAIETTPPLPIAPPLAAAPPPAPAAPTAPPVPSSSPREQAAAVTKPHAPATAKPVPAKTGGSTTKLVVVAVGAIVLLLAVVGIRAMLLWRATQTASVDIETAVARARASQLRDAIAGARQALAAGQLDRAQQHIDTALALDPANAEAIALRQQLATASVPVPAEAPPAEPGTPADVPEASETLPAPEQPSATAAPPAPTIDRETGIVRQKGEAPKAFASRVADAKKVAASLREAVDAGHVADARTLLSQLGSAAPRHPELGPLTTQVHALEARARARAAQAAYEDGKRLQESGTETDLVGARTAYRKAGSLQTGLGEAELQQVDARLQDLGRVALSNARNFQNFKRREQAIEQYKRALLLLGDCADCEKALRDLQQP